MNYYPFNIGDYTRDTSHLEPLEDLAYRRMIDLYYSRELPLPEDVQEIARLIRMRTHCDCIAIVLRDFFALEKDGYHQHRIDAEIFTYKEKSTKASKSAKARWNKSKEKQPVTPKDTGDANALRSQCEGNAKQETRNKKQETRNNSNTSPSKPDLRFCEFWEAYPKKVDKKKANATWKNKNLDSIADKIIQNVIDRAANDEQWQDKKYLPNPTTFLNGERWDDEFTNRTEKPATANKKPGTSALDRVLAGIERDNANQTGNEQALGDDDPALRPQVDEQLWGGGRPDGNMGGVIEGSCTRHD